MRAALLAPVPLRRAANLRSSPLPNRSLPTRRAALYYTELFRGVSRDIRLRELRRKIPRNACNMPRDVGGGLINESIPDTIHRDEYFVTIFADPYRIEADSVETRN